MASAAQGTEGDTATPRGMQRTCRQAMEDGAGQLQSGGEERWGIGERESQSGSRATWLNSASPKTTARYNVENANQWTCRRASISQRQGLRIVPE